MTSRNALRTRLVSALDLVVDLTTLGEYGIEERVPSSLDCTRRSCEQDNHFAAWENLVAPRRGACAQDKPALVALSV